jgi:hypothetical protein
MLGVEPLHLDQLDIGVLGPDPASVASTTASYQRHTTASEPPGTSAKATK